MSLLTDITTSVASALQDAGVQFDVLQGPTTLQRENVVSDQFYVVVAITGGTVSAFTRDRFISSQSISVYFYVKSRKAYEDFLNTCLSAIKRICADMFAADKAVNNAQFTLDTELADAGDTGLLFTFETEVEL